MSRTTGIETRHARGCPARVKDGNGERGECRCRPTFQAHLWSARDKKRIRKTFRTFSAARSWRADATVGLRKGELRAPTRRTVREVADELLAGMESGDVRAKGGRSYKASTVGSYRASLTKHVYPDLGAVRLSDLAPVDVQALVDRLVASGLSGQTVRNATTALAVVYRYARRRGWVSTNPARDLELPAAGRRRERIVDPAEAKTLLDPLPTDLRALYGIAIYAGARRGEIAALTWDDVDFAEGTITISRAYCWRAKGFQDTKSDAGGRVVPMVAPLAAILLEHRVASGGTGLLFPRPGDRSLPFDPRSVARRSETVWKRQAQERARAAGENPSSVTWNRLVLHEGRHSAASAFIASGRDPVRVAEWMGHSQVSTTLDIYAKAFKVRERQDTAAVDAFYAAFSSEAVEADAG